MSCPGVMAVVYNEMGYRLWRNVVQQTGSWVVCALCDPFSVWCCIWRINDVLSRRFHFSNGIQFFVKSAVECLIYIIMLTYHCSSHSTSSTVLKWMTWVLSPFKPPCYRPVGEPVGCFHDKQDEPMFGDTPRTVVDMTVGVGVLTTLPPKDQHSWKHFAVDCPLLLSLTRYTACTVCCIIPE